MGINFRGHGGMVVTIVVGFAKYASYCELIFVDKRPQNPRKLYTSKVSTHTVKISSHK